MRCGWWGDKLSKGSTMRVRVIALFLVSLCPASFVRAQTQGQITGVVTDSSGAVVAGAAITVTNPQTNFTRQVQTNSTGNLRVPHSASGTLQPQGENTRLPERG